MGASSSLGPRGGSVAVSSFVGAPEVGEPLSSAVGGPTAEAPQRAAVEALQQRAPIADWRKCRGKCQMVKRWVRWHRDDGFLAFFWRDILLGATVVCARSRGLCA